MPLSQWSHVTVSLILVFPMAGRLESFYQQWCQVRYLMTIIVLWLVTLLAFNKELGTGKPKTQHDEIWVSQFFVFRAKAL